jgi:tetratricopeptide (TPR) repeat protein
MRASLFLVSYLAFLVTGCSNQAKQQYDRGAQALKANDPDLAISCMNEAIRLDPNYSDAYLKRGQAYVAKGDFAKAVGDCSEAIRLNPKNARAYWVRGIVYVIQGKHQAGADDAAKAKEIDPELVERLKKDMDNPTK